MREPGHPLHRTHGATWRADVASLTLDHSIPSPWRRPEHLNDGAKALMNALPARISVTAIALDFPHVLNRIAIVWPDATAFEQEMWGLLFGDRSDREGFPFAVEDELLALQAYRLEEADDE